MACSECDGTVFARGLCQKHYNRLRRTGQLARRNAVNIGTCKVEGCDRVAHAAAMCSRHYQLTRGEYRSLWQTLRSRWDGEYPKAWDDYDAFVFDIMAHVGARPSDRHQFRRIREDQPWGAENIRWLEPLPVKGFNGSAEERAAYMRAWAYRKKYGITVEDFDRMWASQGGRCAICRYELEKQKADTGRVAKTCVDHDHVTGAARGLLCDDCNKALGMFHDSTERIQSAIAYLAEHAVTA